MKKFIISLFVIFNILVFAHQAFCQLTDKSFGIVTDIDDTIRITNVLSYYEVIRRGLSSTEVFLGMKELFEELSKASKEIDYLSASPHWIEARVKSSLIDRMGFPLGNFILSNWLWWESTESFKSREILNIAKRNELSFVIVGDDTQVDPEVFANFRDHFDEKRVLNIYIHQIQNRSLPHGVTPYRTAYDIALYELEDGRLTPEQVIRVGESILNATRLELVFPYFKYCPKDYTHELGLVAKENQAIIQMNEKMQEKVQSYCVKRNELSLNVDE